jgi:ABC-type uncharacterized transport system involved in gliding motility auxiliary subunit
MKQTLDRITPYFPWLGLLLILAGAIVFFITRQADITSNALLLAGALLLLLFALLRPDDVRRMMSGRQARYGLSTALSILFFAAITIILYWIAYRNTDWRWDLTETARFTPLPETVELLEQLDEPVHVIGFYTAQLGAQQDEARAILESLKSVSDKISYEFQDPEVNPVLAQQYELNFNGTLVFIKGEGENETSAKANSLSDQDIHSALLQVANPTEKKVYFLSGHGERGVGDFAETGLSTAVDIIEDSGFDVAPLTLAISGTVPEDATAIALIDQQAPLLADEVTAIGDYLAAGGSMFLVRDVVGGDDKAAGEGDDLAAYLLDEWGISLRRDIIIDVQQALAQQTLGLGFVPSRYGASPIITADLQQGELLAIFFQARSLNTQEVTGVSQTELVFTSNGSWGETNFEALQQLVAEANEGEDVVGPLVVGVSAENTETGARLVVFGDGDFISNRDIVQGGNSVLFSNIMNWLANDEVSINLTPRETVTRSVVVPQGQLNLMTLVSVCLGPVVMTIAGVSVWYSRRRKR